MSKKAIYLFILALALVNLSGLMNYHFGDTANPMYFLLILILLLIGALVGWFATALVISKNNISDIINRPFYYKLIAGLPWLLASYLIFSAWKK